MRWRNPVFLLFSLTTVMAAIASLLFRDPWLYIALLASIAVCAVLLLSWVRDRVNAIALCVGNIDSKVAAVGARIATVEQALEGLPSKESLTAMVEEAGRKAIAQITAHVDARFGESAEFFRKSEDARHRDFEQVFIFQANRSAEQAQRQAAVESSIARLADLAMDQWVETRNSIHEVSASSSRAVTETSLRTQEQLTRCAKKLDSLELVITDQLATLKSEGHDQLVEVEQAISSSEGRVFHCLNSVITEIQGSRTSLGDVVKEVEALKDKASVDLGRATNELIREFDALLHLHSSDTVSQCEPLLGDWAMDPIGLQAVLRIVRDRRPSLVVECGSGASTVWIARALQALGAGQLVALEHLEEYRAKLEPDLQALGLDQIADVRLAPLEPRKVGDDEVHWYCEAGTRFCSESIDLLLVDGPPGTCGQQARFPALPLLVEALAPGAIILLDDYGRADEVAIGERWMKQFPQLHKVGMVGPRTLAFEWKVDK